MQDFKSKKSQRYAMQRYGWTIGLAASVLAAVRLFAADSAVAVADPIFVHSQGQVVQMADAQPDSLMAHVEGKRWQLVSWQDTQGKATKAIGTVTLEFAGASVSGTGGCNRFRAPYVSEGGSQIRISAISSTRMACADPAMSAQESRFFSGLQSAQSLMFDSQGQLAIRYRSASGGEATLIFAADSEGSQSQSLSLNGTAWQLTAWQQGTTPKSLVADTPITVTFTGDRISGSGGCNIFSGIYRQQGTTLNVSNLMMTERACASLVAMQQETELMQSLETIRSLQLTGSGLELALAYRSPQGQDGVLKFVRAADPTVTPPQASVDSTVVESSPESPSSDAGFSPSQPPKGCP